ncbi:MAG: hypothetical protein K2V38_05660 [Gemmataceae bacterium]|nr:hypothetical protein [Gemmataceae bacterium]
MAVVLAAAVGYLAFSPGAARDASNWVRRQVGETPNLKGAGTPNYMPITPGR